MDFRELINKIDAVNAEAKKEPERLSFDDAINHVKDITFTPPTQSGIKFSSANNMKFKGKDVNDPKIKLALFQDELKNSPARLLGEIASRIKPSSDAQMDLSGHVGMLGEKLAQGNMMVSQLSKPEQKLAIEVIKQALRSMELERDPDADIEYKDDDEPDAKEMESTNEADYDRDSVTYDEVLPFVKMTYKKLLTDLQTIRKDIETYKAGGDTGEEGGDIDMIMPYLRDLKDMQVKVKTILDNPDMDINVVVDYMMPADLDTSAREELIGRFKKSFAKDPQLAKRLFKDPQLGDADEGVEEKEEEPVAEEETWFNNLSDVTLHGDDFYETFGWIEENDEHVEEAEYQGRNVKLNKPMRGDVKKFKVYVKNPKGNVVKVNFGDPTMRIKKSNPARRRSFRARHNCDSPGPKHKARYWSCKKW